jgi:hypothetical protein
MPLLTGTTSTVRTISANFGGGEAHPDIERKKLWIDIRKQKTLALLILLMTNAASKSFNGEKEIYTLVTQVMLSVYQVNDAILSSK